MENIVTAIILSKKKIFTIDIPKTTDINNLELDTLTYKIKKGKGNIERHCDWQIENNNVISLYGWKDGKPGSENPHEIPPPEDVDLYFGDILIIKSDSNKLVNFNKDNYEEFIETACGGFEDLGINDTDDESDDDDENEYDKNDSFIATSDEDEDDDEDDYDDDDDEDEDEDEDEEDEDEDEDDDELESDQEDKISILTNDEDNTKEVEKEIKKINL